MYQALFDRYGVQRVDDMDQLATALIMFAQPHPVGAGGLVSIHDSGGERQLLIDLAHDANVPLTHLTRESTEKLASLLDPGLPAVNPLDAWSTGGPDYHAGMQHCFADVDGRSGSSFRRCGSRSCGRWRHLPQLSGLSAQRSRHVGKAGISGVQRPRDRRRRACRRSDSRRIPGPRRCVGVPARRTLPPRLPRSSRALIADLRPPPQARDDMANPTRRRRRSSTSTRRSASCRTFGLPANPGAVVQTWPRRA